MRYSLTAAMVEIRRSRAQHGVAEREEDVRVDDDDERCGNHAASYSTLLQLGVVAAELLRYPRQLSKTSAPILVARLLE
jgi:hypothetical protein